MASNKGYSVLKQLAILGSGFLLAGICILLHGYFFPTLPGPIVWSGPTAKDSSRGITIVGSQKFVPWVGSALDLLQAKDPPAFDTVKGYIGVIEESSISGMQADSTPPAFFLTDDSAYSSITWCASDIAHDSYHSKLYHDYSSKNQGPVPDSVWIGEQAERECCAYQLAVLAAIGAPQSEMDYLRSIDYSYWRKENRNW